MAFSCISRLMTYLENYCQKYFNQPISTFFFSKYSGAYMPPHHKAARRKLGKNGWSARQIDMMPVITDVPPLS